MMERKSRKHSQENWRLPEVGSPDSGIGYEDVEAEYNSPRTSRVYSEAMISLMAKYKELDPDEEPEDDIGSSLKFANLKQDKNLGNQDKHDSGCDLDLSEDDIGDGHLIEDDVAGRNTEENRAADELLENNRGALVDDDDEDDDNEMMGEWAIGWEWSLGQDEPSSFGTEDSQLMENSRVVTSRLLETMEIPG